MMSSIRAAAWLVLIGVISAAAAAPDPLTLRVPNADGRVQTLTEYRGRVVLLNFWSTTCPPCKVETPWFVEFQERWRDRGLVILGVSMDDSPAQIKAFMQQYRINYPMFEGRAVEEQIQKTTGGIWGMPTTFLIGRDGQVITKHLGLVGKGRWERDIEAAVKATAGR